MKHLIIKNKVRFSISMLIIFVVFHSLLNLIGGKVFSYQAPKYKEITVSQGDTLWSISCQLKGNINENIYNIQKLNSIDDCNIYVGQTLKIPVS